MSNLSKASPVINKPQLTSTGTDYFGPLTITQRTCTRSTDGVFKRYGAICICLSTRAVNVELVGNLSTNNFILTLRLFILATIEPILQVLKENYPNL